MLKIASYNLHKCRGMTGPHAPLRNLAVIRSLDPDIIALQEVGFRLGARPEALSRNLIQSETGLVPADIYGTTESSLGWHGQTILMRPHLAEQAVLRRIRDQLKDFPGYAKIRRVSLKLEPWTVEDGLLTPTMKVKRAKVLERYHNDVEGMYSGG